MIEISVIDFHRAGFEGVRVRDSIEDLLIERELPLHLTGWSQDINGHRIGDVTHTDYPTNMLYEFPVFGAQASHELLKQAVANAEAGAQAAGFAKRGRRLYKLVLVNGEDQKLWVRVGNEWVDKQSSP